MDAFNDPNANSDLKVYRSHFHLPACTTSNGCLHILNQHGKGSPLPRADAGWAVEESLDLDMVSAICPKCHIMLIEATNPSDVNLGTAEDTAIARGAKYVSNSWGNAEFSAESTFNHYFNHPGHVIDFAAGDLGYGSTYPAALQFVTSIGGTSLRHSGNGRGWTESVWGTGANNPPDGTASGCSAFEAKPSWQLSDASRANGCKNRTENDASAVRRPQHRRARLRHLPAARAASRSAARARPRRSSRGSTPWRALRSRTPTRPSTRTCTRSTCST